MPTEPTLREFALERFDALLTSSMHYYTPQSLRECIVFGRCVCLSVCPDFSVLSSVRIAA